MSRIDKYGPYTGGFRAKLNAAIPASNAGKMYAVSINTSGRVVIGGAATTDLKGVICATEAMDLGKPIDVMTSGEIANATTTAGAALTAGANIYGHTDGTIDAVATAGKALGFTVELDRVIVRTQSV